MKNTICILKRYLFLIIGLCSTTLLAHDNDSTSITKVEEGTTIFKLIHQERIPTFTLKTNIDLIISDKRTNNRHPAILTFTSQDGTVFKKLVELKPRGKSRRKYCDFPPLQVRFSKKELQQKGISSNHKNLKLVTHCLDGYAANPNVLKEYLAYKIYQELTPKSLKVQLLKTRYEDTQSEKIIERYGILLEDIDELAARLQGKEIDRLGNKLKDFSKEDRAIFMLFQYMIGNDDWDILTQRNLKLIQLERKKQFLPIPYDFDASGLVATVYAKPNPNYRLKSVQQRLFMGKFSNKQERQKTINLFNAKKDNIYQLIDDLKELDSLVKLEVKDYLDSFYQIINTPQLLKRALPVNGKRASTSDMEGKMQAR